MSGFLWNFLPVEVLVMVIFYHYKNKSRDYRLDIQFISKSKKYAKHI